MIPQEKPFLLLKTDEKVTILFSIFIMFFCYGSCSQTFDPNENKEAFHKSRQTDTHTDKHEYSIVINRNYKHISIFV